MNSMIVGTEWLVDASGCSAAALCDVRLLRRVCERVIAELNLQVVGEMLWHQFPRPGGITGLALLSESHLACHTYPEYGVATFNLYCCRPRPEWPWAEGLSEMLGAREVKIQAVERLFVANIFPQLEHPFQVARAKES
jgi:S-adenosylmethionine decarboxylase